MQRSAHQEMISEAGHVTLDLDHNYDKNRLESLRNPRVWAKLGPFKHRYLCGDVSLGNLWAELYNLNCCARTICLSAKLVDWCFILPL